MNTKEFESILKINKVLDKYAELKRAIEDFGEHDIAMLVKFKDYLSKESDMKNELCQKCGKYKQSHLGTCDGCRWNESEVQIK